MTNKKNEKITKEEKFLYKYKNDKKYKAKVELTGYVIFILITVLFVNIASLGNTYPSNLTNQIIPNNNDTEEKELTLLEQIDDNYQYDININLTKTTEEVINYHYYGTSNNNTLEINKESNNNTTTYYKIKDSYYKKQEQDYIDTTKEEIYDLINNKYIELNNLLEYINEASLDHVTNYSNGKKEYVYNLYLRDIILNNKTEDTININLVEENETLTISVDYSNLIKETDNTIKECKINYIYNNINKIEQNIEEQGDINE